MSAPLETVTGDLTAAMAEVPAGWWFSVCACTLTLDASIGPDFRNSACPRDHVQRFDSGFHAELPPPATMADALRHCIRAAREAGA